MVLNRYESVESGAQALAKQVAEALGDAVRLRGTASLLVPGGRTPVPFFRALRGHDLAWTQVRISLTDERWVPPDHADSNARLVNTELFAEAAAAALFVPLYNSASTASLGAARSWRSLAVLPRPFDVVVLGMGDDGHFASLFPDSPELGAALDPTTAPACVPMRAPSPPVDRISLNLAALAHARQLYLFITGRHKLALIESADARGRLPIDALLELRQPEPRVYWAP